MFGCQIRVFCRCTGFIKYLFITSQQLSLPINKEIVIHLEVSLSIADCGESLRHTTFWFALFCSTVDCGTSQGQTTFWIMLFCNMHLSLYYRLAVFTALYQAYFTRIIAGSVYEYGLESCIVGKAYYSRDVSDRMMVSILYSRLLSS